MPFSKPYIYVSVTKKSQNMCTYKFLTEKRVDSMLYKKQQVKRHNKTKKTILIPLIETSDKLHPIFSFYFCKSCPLLYCLFFKLGKEEIKESLLLLSHLSQVNSLGPFSKPGGMVMRTMAWDNIYNGCCVFWLTNICSKHCLLVKFTFLDILQHPLLNCWWPANRADDQQTGALNAVGLSKLCFGLF